MDVVDLLLGVGLFLLCWGIDRFQRKAEGAIIWTRLSFFRGCPPLGCLFTSSSPAEARGVFMSGSFLTGNGLLQIALYFAVLFALVKPLGGYIAYVYEGQAVWMQSRWMAEDLFL